MLIIEHCHHFHLTEKMSRKNDFLTRFPSSVEVVHKIYDQLLLSFSSKSLIKRHVLIIFRDVSPRTWKWCRNLRSAFRRSIVTFERQRPFCKHFYSIVEVLARIMILGKDFRKSIGTFETQETLCKHFHTIVGVLPRLMILRKHFRRSIGTFERKETLVSTPIPS